MKQITCPNCGATEFKQLSNTVTQCEYCQSKFGIEYKEDSYPILPMSPRQACEWLDLDYEEVKEQIKRLDKESKIKRWSFQETGLKKIADKLKQAI